MKVRRRNYPSGKVKYVADLGLVAGKRVERLFDTEELAKEFLRKAKAERKQDGDAALILPAGDRIRYLEAVKALNVCGATIEDAVRFYLQHHKGKRETPSWEHLIREWVGNLERLKRVPKYVAMAQRNLESFVKAIRARPLEDVSKDDVQDWVTESILATGTQTNRRTIISSFLNWALERRYLSVNPIAGQQGRIKLATDRKEEILAFGSSQIRALLKVGLFGEYHAFNPDTGEFYKDTFHTLLGYITATTFCGIRPDEIKGTELVKLNPRERTLVVKQKKSRSNKTRVVELSQVAVVWFRLWLRFCPGQTSFFPQNGDRRWRALRKAAGFTNWLHDGLRHTFASMHYAAHQNTATLKACMGHSQTEETLFQNYRAVTTTLGETITKKMAQEFWEMTPRQFKQKIREEVA